MRTINYRSLTLLEIDEINSKCKPLSKGEQAIHNRLVIEE